MDDAGATIMFAGLAVQLPQGATCTLEGGKLVLHLKAVTGDLVLERAPVVNVAGSSMLDGRQRVQCAPDLVEVEAPAAAAASLESSPESCSAPTPSELPEQKTRDVDNNATMELLAPPKRALSDGATASASKRLRGSLFGSSPALLDRLTAKPAAAEAYVAVPRWGHSGLMISEDALWVFGGMEEGALDSWATFEVSRQAWCPGMCAVKATPRAWNAATFVASSKQVLIFGGEEGPDKPLGDLVAFDTTLGVWYEPTTSGPAPGGRSGVTASVVNTDKVVLFGGMRGRKWTDDLVVLDTGRWRWSRPRIAGTGPRPRSYHTATTMDESIIIFGGNNAEQSFNDVYVLQTFDESWSWFVPTMSGSAPPCRTGHSATQISGTMIAVFGGWDPQNDDGPDVPFSDLYMLHAGMWSWTCVKQWGPIALPQPSEVSSESVVRCRTGHAAGVAVVPGHGKCLIIHGGMDGTDVHADMFAVKVEELLK